MLKVLYGTKTLASKNLLKDYFNDLKKWLNESCVIPNLYDAMENTNLRFESYSRRRKLSENVKRKLNGFGMTRGQ